MGQGADDAELREQGDAAGAFELRSRTSQMRSDPGEGDLWGVGLQHHQVALQWFEGQAALLVEASGTKRRRASVKVRARRRQEVCHEPGGLSA